MKDRAEEKVASFYETTGWQFKDGTTESARIWEDLRECARDYVSQCRLRVLRHIPSSGESMIDMASGPIQFPKYLEYSKIFKKRYCVDLTSRALKEAERKIGDRGVYLQGNFLDMHVEDDFFDCAISLHTIYHIDKDRQEDAVRKLLKITKPGKPVIIVYINPRPAIRILGLPVRLVKRLTAMVRGVLDKTAGTPGVSYLYFHAYPISWWNRFRDVADIEILPYRSFATRHQKLLVPNNNIGRTMLSILFGLEDRFPHFFAN